MTKKFIDNLPLLTAILIYYAYCNLYYYYKEFKIDIYNYISNSELVLSFLPTIVVITATIGTYIISYIIGSNTSDKQNSKKVNEPFPASETPKQRQSFFKSQYGTITLLILIALITFFTTRYLLNTHHQKRYELKEYFLYVSFVTAFSTYLVLKGIGGQEIFINYSSVILLALIIYIGQQIGNYKKLEAEEVREGISTNKISFKYNGSQIFKTDTTLIFLGQTQSTLFLYKTTDSSTLVFKKEYVDSMIIK